MTGGAAVTSQLVVVLVLAACSSSSIRFENVTATAGIVYEGASWSVAWGRYNADPWPDLWASNHGQQPSLYVARGDGRTFRDIGSLVAALPRVDAHGAAWADFDGDGDQDLIETVGAGRGDGTGANRLYVHEGGVFRNEAIAWGVDYPLGRGRTPLWLDANGDGVLDLMLVNAARAEAPSTLLVQEGASFRAVPGDSPLNVVHDSSFAQLATLGEPGSLHAILHGYPYPARVYRLDDDELAAVDDRLDIPPTPHVLDAAIGDFDGDLDQDLFLVGGSLASDVDQPDPGRLHVKLTLHSGSVGLRFRAEGPVHFDLRPIQADWWLPERIYLGAASYHPQQVPFELSPSEAAVHGLPVRPAGVERGIFIGYQPEEDVWELRLESNREDIANAVIRSAAAFERVETVGWEPIQPELRNRLLINRGGKFVDATEQFGLDGRENCYSTTAGDFDNDGDLDLYLSCSRTVANRPNVLYENLGGSGFRRVPEAGGAAGTTEGVGDAVAAADYDLDGFLDLFVANGRDLPPFNTGPHQLFRNLGNGNHWLEIDLEGTASNRDGIGARVVVSSGGHTQTRFQGGGMHHGAQDFRRIHFGLGPNDRASRIEVHWPSGVVQELRDVESDQILRIREPDVSG